MSIESDPIVSEVPYHVEEIAGTAAQIENAQGRRTVEPEILSAFDIDANPVVGIVEPVDPGRVRRVWIFFAQPGELFSIKRRENSIGIDRMHPTAGMFPHAVQRFAGKQFSKLMGNAHNRMMRGCT